MDAWNKGTHGRSGLIDRVKASTVTEAEAAVHPQSNLLTGCLGTQAEPPVTLHHIDQLQPGDLIIYYPDAHHVGMYVGDGYVIHASTFGVPVKVVPVDGAGPYLAARRV